MSNNAERRMTHSFEHFMEHFKRVPVLDADSLYCEEWEVVNAALRKEAQRGIGLSTGSLSWESHGLTAPQMIRLKEYRRLFADKAQHGKVDLNTAIYDLDQNAIERGRMASHLPTLLRHNTSWSETWGAAIVAARRVRCYGMAVYPSMPWGRTHSTICAAAC